MFQVKKSISVRGGYLSSAVLLTIAVQCIEVEAKYIKVREAINQFNQKSWRFMAHNMIVDANQDNWIKQSRYDGSITNVIGKAIGDCITDMGEFEEKSRDQLITFAADPVKYKRRHWNAVFVYNYLNILKHDILDKQEINSDQILNDVYVKILDHYHYKNIKGLNALLNYSKRDIKEYSQKLDLENKLKEFINVVEPIKDKNAKYFENTTKKYLRDEENKYKRIRISPILEVFNVRSKHVNDFKLIYTSFYDNSLRINMHNDVYGLDNLTIYWDYDENIKDDDIGSEDNGKFTLDSIMFITYKVEDGKKTRGIPDKLTREIFLLAEDIIMN